MRLVCHLHRYRGDRSLREIAELSGVAAGNLSRIEAGRELPLDRHIPGMETAYRQARERLVPTVGAPPNPGGRPVRAHVERNWLTRQINIWLYDQAGRFTITYAIGAEGELVGIKHEDDGMGKLPDRPTLSLPQEAFEAIVKEGAGIVPPSEATHDALVDARAQRDRLLAMVESEWASRQLERR